MKTVKMLLFSMFFSVAVSSLAGQKVKNIIFMIGDGMGANQVYAGMTANGNKLNLEQCTYTGFHKTYSASDYITDSAAGGTALACGQKTKNGMIGMSPDSVPIYSSMYAAQQNGLATGFVVTCVVAHATPAAFYAHQPSRKMYEEITLDLIHNTPDIFIGGGRKHLENRSDSINLTDSLRKTGYQVAYNLEELQSMKGSKIAGLLANGDMPDFSIRKDMLPVSVEKAIEVLSDTKKGFFLMVEGSQIDYKGHDNDAEGVVGEMIDFDKAIGKALEFAKKDKHTLVVITADHETGSMTLKSGDFQTGKVTAQFNTKGHSGVLVPIFAYGPGSENFTGIMENTALKAKCLQLLGINEK
ncbi:MAG: alkaline phosphatase [Sphingobacteriia bacterium]|jgi:alkaline phosphatase|nr:alkaline phosphatase [Sphingobacteriia bacterium]